MSDQGYPPPGYGQGEQPGYGYQPQQEPQGGSYGQQPPGQWGNPPPYGTPPAGGQYGGGQYGPPQGQPAYGPPQGQPPYGGEPPYGPPPSGPGGGTTPPSGGGFGGRKGLLAGLTAVVVAAGLGVGGYFLFAGGSDSGSPSGITRQLLDAGVRGDVAAATATLCKSDIALHIVNDLDSGGRLRSYTIGRTEQQDSTHAAVHATVTPVHGRMEPVTFPVLKENGSWKVCISSRPDFRPGVGAAPSVSVPSISVPSISVPSISVPSISVPSISVPSIAGVGGYCASSVSALTTAETYVGGAELGEPDLAQGCVYQNAVAGSVTKHIASLNKLFAPTGGVNGPVFRFTSTDGSTQLAVTVEQQSDGKYYVTDVRIG
ncbi:MAG TPA: hypothetical protein VFH38_04540 [Jatrophihabitans sp.]|nr:hypothetical protein [Jatrophihabitans sp.]